MALVEITCLNPDCPKYQETYIGTEVPHTLVDPGYVEGTCPGCGEEPREYAIEELTPTDIEYLRCEFLGEI